MTLIHEIVSKNLPAKRRNGSKGWITTNAVCCHHRGHRKDSRFRGNFLFTQDGVIVYNCYNCGFITKYNGVTLSKNFELLMHWLGISNEDIKKIKFNLLQSQLQGNQSNDSLLTNFQFVFDFKEIKLPLESISINSLLTHSELTDDFISVMEYLIKRGNAVSTGWNYYWSSSTKFNMNSRIIIPFYYKNVIVGWTARYAGTPPEGVPRYYNSELQSGYIFNCDVMYKLERKYITVHEGPFDAISVDGVGILGSEISKEQTAWLNSIDKEKIVVPDRQKNNQGLIDAALTNGWYVSFPDWEDNVKDSADATMRYGKLFTLQTIINSKTKNQLQIGIKRKMFKN